MIRTNRVLKAQSAMEYLMTYGWAILIIAVVLGALFSLGVFGANTATTACIAGPGYLCTGLVLGPLGNLSFTFGQSTGSTIYNIGMGCAAVSTGSGLPSTSSGNSIVYLGPSGAATWNSAASPFNGVLSMPTGETLTISALKCFGTNLAPLVAPAIGTTFSGGLWINYTASSGTPGGSNPTLTSKFATLSAKVV